MPFIGNLSSALSWVLPIGLHTDKANALREDRRMKRKGFVVVAISVVFLSLGLLMNASVEAKDDKSKEKAAPAPAAAPAKPTEKVAYTFADQTKVDAFAKLWQQRQATVLRMTVLKSYFLEEEETLKKLNDQFAKDYNLDVSKNYKFDNERKVILELDTPAAPPAPAVGSAQ